MTSICVITPKTIQNTHFNERKSRVKIIQNAHFSQGAFFSNGRVCLPISFAGLLTHLWYRKDGSLRFDSWVGMSAGCRSVGSSAFLYQKSGRHRRGGENSLLSKDSKKGWKDQAGRETITVQESKTK